MRIDTPLLVALTTVVSVAAQSHAYHELRVGDAALRYAVVLPAGYDAADSHPLLFALPPGKQDEAMVEAGLARYWGTQAREAGWIVVSPVAPDGQRFHEGAEDLLPALLRHVRTTYRIEGARMHLAGASNGGRSAFRVATLQPHEFCSLTVLPGDPPTAADKARLAQLRGVPVRMFVGGEDGDWVRRTRETAVELKALGVDVTSVEFPGEGHVPASLDGGVVMAGLVDLHRAALPPESERAVHDALDDFHDAAAKADSARYFGRFAPGGVFLGTDATERWGVEEFKQYAKAAFARPSAWIYVPQRRSVELAPSAVVAWFDETVVNSGYGACRGTGVLRRIEGVWRLAQYNLTVPVPNDLLRGVVRQIRAFEAGATTAATTVILMRHAETGVGDDPPLSDLGRARATRVAALLRPAGVDAIYTTEFKRTVETAQPLGTALGVEPVVVLAARSKQLAARLLADHAGETVFVVGHSNTVPAILRALDVSERVRIDEEEYGRLFVVSIDSAGARLLQLQVPQ